ncbi:MAG: CDP-alcohol phosphatidyltransferase family protein [Legionellaceae bacterium]|nr:CDP-alcohol phosphatidyltransferase family protein [Legionellaceae bacterium]
MIEHYVRACYQKLLVDPLAQNIGHFITPNQVTVFSGFLGLLVLPALIMHQVTPAIIFLLLSGYCDTLDGTLARLNHQSSDWGTVLDIMTDRLVEFTVVFALWSVAPVERGLGCLLMLGSMLLCITSFLVVGIFSQNGSQKGFHYSPGIMERAEAFCFFIAMMLFPRAFNLLAYLFTLLVVLTAVIRTAQFYKLSRE